MRRFKNFNLGNLKNASHSGKISFVYNYVTKLYRSGICNEYYYFIFLISILIYMYNFNTIYFWVLNECMNEGGMERE